MKKVHALLLTLVLSVSMLVPEFAMLPAAYAEDQTPALTQSVENDEVNAAASEPAADNQGAAAADSAAPEDEPGSDTEGLSASGEELESLDALEEAEGLEATEDSKVTINAYEKLSMTDLDDKGALVIPDALKETIKLSHSDSGAVLVKGTVADLNALKIKIGGDFDFNDGSVGRLSFDGLKDKDRGMTVKVQVYLDDEAEPVSEFALKKQMGKTDWSNDGEQSISLGSKKIAGRHSISLGLKVEGKKDDAKTTVAIRSLQFCKTTVPVMYINIDESEGTVEAMNSSDDHSVECYGSVDLVVPDEFNDDSTFRDEYGTQKSLYGLDLEYIRGRGNSTWSADKKPYKVKFDKAQDLFGFGKNKHWTLIANRYDNSLVRNRMTYWLGQQLGMEYTPQCVPVEVVMNGEFYGSYLLCEQIRVGTGRVTIDDLDDVKDAPAVTDPLIQTGGYLLSMDYNEDEYRHFKTKKEMELYIESPDDNVKYFSEYIKSYTQKVENAIYGDGFRDEGGHPYTDYLDMDSAVDYWWIQEFSANGDAFGSGSTYLYKKRDGENDPGKLYWGPLWDFDYVAWGDLHYDDDSASDGLDNTNTPWFDMMKTDPVFIEKVKARWSEKGGLKENLNEITKKDGLLDKYLAQMETSYIYDHEKWGAYDSKYTEYKDEIEQLRSWIISRTNLVEEALKELKIEDHKVRFEIDGETVKEITVRGFLQEESFPEVPEKEGQVFTAWADKETEEIYGIGTLVESDLTLVAQYINESDIVHPQDIFFEKYDAYVNIDELGGFDNDYLYFFQDHRVMPEDAVDTDITWTSSDENVAAVDEEGAVKVFRKGEATITATLSNGVTKSYKLHVVEDDDFKANSGVQLDRTSLTLKPGEYDQIIATAVDAPAYEFEVVWASANEEVATVDDIGVVRAVAPGTADILAIDLLSRETKKCKVTVERENNVGISVVYKGSTYEITADEEGSRTAMLVKAKNAKSVTIPATISYGGNKYSVNALQEKAFAKSKARTVTVKTKKLTKASVKNSLKGSKVKTVKVKVGKKKTNKTYRKKYKKIFTKKNAGKRVKIK